MKINKQRVIVVYCANHLLHVL